MRLTPGRLFALTLVVLGGILAPGRPAWATGAQRLVLPDGSRATGPVVITWLAPSTARIGRRETLHIRLFWHSRPVAGAAVSTVITWRGRVVMRVPGSTTSRSGEAESVFTIPARLRGRTYQVAVTVRFAGRVANGFDHLRVRK